MDCDRPQAQHAMTVEAECFALKEFLSEVLSDRAALKAEFDQLSAKNQLIIEQMEDEEDSEEDDVSAEGRLLEYQSEKQRLDVKLRDLEEKLRVKDQQMTELDVKASEYLRRVTTSSNSIFDQEESETASVAAEEPCVANETAGAPEEAVVTDILHQAPASDDKQREEPVHIGCVTSKEKEGETRPVFEINEASAKTEDKNVNSIENIPPPEHEVVNLFDSVKQDGAAVNQYHSVTVPSDDQILSLSSLVSELRRVKDEMGKCMSVKEKSFLDLEDELVRSKKDQENLKKQISTMISKMDAKEKKFVNLIEENKKIREELENKSKELETARSADAASEKEELENKLKVLELMMVEYRAEIEAVTGEKTQAEQQAKELVKEIASRSDVSSEKELDLNPSEAELLDNSSSDERATPDISSGDNLDEITQDETFEGYTLLEEENKKLSEKLRSTGRYLKALAKDREDKRKECTVLQEKVQLVEGKMMQLQGTFDKLVSAVMSERDDLVKESDAKSTQIKTLGDKIDVMQQREKLLTQQLVVRSDEQEQLKSNEELRKSFHEESCRQKSEHEKIIKNVSAELQCVKQKHSEEILLLKKSNETYIAEVNKCRSEIERLLEERTKSDDAVNELLAQQLSDKVEECKTLEKKIETINNEMNEFVTCLKEEMARMKEDMAKQSDARLQLEVSYDTLTEEHRDIIMEKKRLQESSVELTIALSDQKALVEAMKEQINVLSTKNNVLSSELHDKEEEYNEELKAREATIQELKVTLTNNQKQSSENYRGLQGDVNTMQLKLVKQEEDSKCAIEQLEQRYSQLVEEKNDLELRMQETLSNYQSDKLSFESSKKDLSLKIDALESERAFYKTKVKSSLQTLQPATGNNVEVGHNIESNDSSDAPADENEVSDEDVADSTSNSSDKAEQIYTKDLTAVWSGSLEELECKLTSAKDELVRVSQSALLTGAGGSAADYRTKIAAMVRHVEELSGVLAATRIRRGLPTKSSVISVTEGESEAPVVGSSTVQGAALAVADVDASSEKRHLQDALTQLQQERDSTARLLATLHFSVQHYMSKGAEDTEVHNMELSIAELTSKLAAAHTDLELKDKSEVEQRLLDTVRQLEERHCTETEEIRSHMRQQKAEYEERLAKEGLDVRSKYEADVKMLTEEVEGLQEIQRSYAKQVSQIEVNNSEMHLKLAGLQDARDQARREACDTLQEKEQLSELYDKLSQVKQSLEAEVATLAADKVTLAGKLEQELKRGAQLEERLALVQQANSELRNEVTNLSLSKEQVSNDLGKLNGAKDELAVSLEQQSSECERLQQELETVREELRAAAVSAQLHDELKTQVERLQTQLKQENEERPVYEIEVKNEMIEKLENELRIEKLKVEQRVVEARTAAEQQHQQELQALAAAYDERLAETAADNEGASSGMSAALAAAREECQDKAEALDLLQHQLAEQDMAHVQQKQRLQAEHEAALQSVVQQWQEQVSRVEADHRASSSASRSEAEVLVRRVEASWRQRTDALLKQREARFKEEMEGLQQEWDKERKELERLTGVAAAAFRSGTDSVELLRSQVQQQRDELQHIKHQHDMEVSELKTLLDVKQRRRRSGGEAVRLAGTLEDAAEFEYLKNVLYQFMMGKETQTLAKVLCAVVKFDQQQQKDIVAFQQSLSSSTEREQGDDIAAGALSCSS